MNLLPALASLALLTGGPGVEKPGIKWERSLDEALKRAKRTGKPVMIDFWAEWCGWCKRLDQTTYVDPQVVKLAEDFVPVKVDSEGTPKEMAIAERYDVSSLPTIVFISPEGRRLLRVRGFQGAGQFPGTLESARDAGVRVMSWEIAIAKNPKDALALMKLGVHLFEQEEYEDARDILARATKADAASGVAERKKARMLLGIIQTYDKKYAEAESVLKEALALKPPGEQEPRILFVLGRAYYNWGKLDKAREAMQQILASYSGSSVAQKARETLLALEKSAPDKRK